MIIIYRYESVHTHMENWKWFERKEDAEEYKAKKGWGTIKEYRVSLTARGLVELLNSI